MRRRFGRLPLSDRMAGRCYRWQPGSGFLRDMVLVGLSLSVSAQGLLGQELADFDYEDLAFRGFGVETGYIFPSRVDPTYTVGVRIDLGYLGPGLRIIPGFTYWSSTMKGGEVRKLERKLETLVEGVDPGSATAPTVDLGTIDWSDIVLSLDGHLVWSMPYSLLSFAGVGVSAHLLNGEGDAISGTFIEDLLDSVTAGFNVHGGLEYPLSDGFRVYGLARYELLEDLRYPEFRVGMQVMLSPPAPGEERTR
ncbi:hypothetical protein ACFL3S_04355 [Gemmatimonadota bacterium]